MRLSPLSNVNVFNFEILLSFFFSEKIEEANIQKVIKRKKQKKVETKQIYMIVAFKTHVTIDFVFQIESYSFAMFSLVSLVSHFLRVISCGISIDVIDQK